MSGALFLALQVAAAAHGQATLTGLVRDADSGRPLVGATVTLLDLHRSTRTDATGSYVFRGVPAGPQHIEVRFMGHAQRTLHALVPETGQLEIHVSLVAVPTRLRQVEVRPGVIVSGVEENAPEPGLDHSISLAAVRNNPQLIEPDVFLSLGGAWVHAQPESPNGIHIRGGASDHTAYLLDEIPVFSPYHSSGVFSAWNPDAIERIGISGAAPRVTEPHVLSGTLSARTRVPGERLQLRASASTSHTRATLDGPLGNGDAGFLLSGRAGYPTLVATKGDQSYTRGITRDWLGKIDLPVRHGRWRLLGYINDNELNTSAVAEAATGPTTPRNRFEWTSVSIGTAWERSDAGKSSRVMAWSAHSTAGSDWLAADAALGMGFTLRNDGVSLSSDRRLLGGTTTLAARLEHLNTRYDIDSLDGSAAPWNLSGRSWLASLGVEYLRSLGDAWRLRAGVATVSAHGRVRASPRAQLQWQMSNTLSVSAGYARMHQLSQSLRNAESVVGNVFPADLLVGVGTTNIPIASSDQGDVRVEYRNDAGAQIGVQAYARSMHGLLLVAPLGGEPFATRSFAVGSATARGASLDLAKSAQRWAVVASYGLQDVEHTLGATRFTPTYGTRQFAEAGIIVFPSTTSSLRLGVAGEGGRRSTTLSGAFEWEACNVRDKGCEFAGTPRADGSSLGGTRLPRYVRIDVGAQKHWHFRAVGRDALVAVFAAMTNVAGRLNVLTYTRNPITGDRSPVEMRPQAPLVVGLDWRF